MENFINFPKDQYFALLKFEFCLLALSSRHSQHSTVKIHFKGFQLPLHRLRHSPRLDTIIEKRKDVASQDSNFAILLNTALAFSIWYLISWEWSRRSLMLVPRYKYSWTFSIRFWLMLKSSYDILSILINHYQFRFVHIDFQDILLTNQHDLCHGLL